MEETVINGVKVIKDGDVTHFTIEQEQPKDGFFKRIWNWMKGHDTKPYVKIRDAADPFEDRDDCDRGCDGKNGIEAGVRISF